MILAHGLGGRSDLPVPLWLALNAGAAAVLVSFLALTALWTRPRLRGAEGGRAVRLPVPRVALKVVGVLLLAGFLAVAWGGPSDVEHNPAPAWFYAWFWVGLVPVSLLFGPVWRLANPLRTLAAGLGRLVPRRELPAVGHWPAVVSLFAFLWLELASGFSDSVRVVAVFVTVYAVVHVVAGAVFGPGWFDRGDGFELYSVLVAALSPLGRRADGALVLRNPLDGLMTLQARSGLTPFVLLVLGSTVFDGLTRLPVWTSAQGTSVQELFGTSAAVGTVGLVVAVAATALAYAGAIRLTRPYLRRSVAAYDAFAHTLVPIMVGYTVAHYFSFAVFEGQRGWTALSGASVDYTLLSAGLIAAVQVGGIVLGHVLAVTSAHDRSLRDLRPGYERVGQYPMLALMVGCTAVGIALVSGV
ncbi:hypothetical protein UO65_5565 [Actinokineospora spheciospongiae]|uniref:Fenitrothion hydrolase n=1 Tax=Actinokineospora spheciospongiae TaxID=909613 RepID=W7IFP8_9PSEU|nr:hypothetical protein [Actinokineospora spheciospongiae]EWC59138.1 hypothetical protein UO65_5565 [Actinokineospora spheciospongiae]